MLSKVCFYNNKLFIPDFSGVESFLVAYAYKQNYKAQDKKFDERLKLEIPTKCTYVKEICLKVVNNFVTGLKCVLILIFDLSGLKESFLYSDTFRKKLLRITLPEMFIGKDTQTSSLFISDGPTFLLFSNDICYVYSTPHGLNNYIDCKLFPRKYKDLRVLQFKSFNSYTNEKPQLLHLLVLFGNSSGNQQINVLAITSNSTEEAAKYEQLSLSYFFPHYYQTVLNAMKIKVCPSIKMKSENLRDFDWEENISVICTTNDCLVFIKGILKYCCKLSIPFSELMCIRTNFCSMFPQNMNFMLTAENKTSCMIAMKESISCEIVKCWTDIEAMVIGDVLLKGSEQVLLMKSTDVDLWQENCILFDILSFVPIDLLSQNTMPYECLQTTISGLEKKIQEHIPIKRTSFRPYSV